MACCFSFSKASNEYLKNSFRRSGLRSKLIDLGDGTKMHCWIPKNLSDNKRSLVLVHGVGGSAIWQWGYQIGPLGRAFNIYVPDLVFFGKSFTTRPERTEQFQAQCIKKMMELLGVNRFTLLGLSYGGFVVYSLAHLYPDSVDKLVLIAAGVCLEEKDLEGSLLVVSDLTTALSILLPETVAKLKELTKFAFVKPPRIPSCMLRDFINVMGIDKRQEKEQLLRSLIFERKLSNLPVIQQDTLVIWGENDRIFPVELAHRLKSHLGDRAELVLLKNTGHAVNFERPKVLNKTVKEFILKPKGS